MELTKETLHQLPSNRPKLKGDETLEVFGIHKSMKIAAQELSDYTWSITMSEPSFKLGKFISVCKLINNVRITLHPSISPI